LDSHAAGALLSQESTERLAGALEQTIGVDSGHPCRQQQRARTPLLESEVEQTGLVFQHGAQRERHDRNRAGPEPQRVIVAPMDFDDREGGVAGASVSAHHDPVAEVIADQRLHMVGQIGQQRRRPKDAGRYRMAMLIDRLENDPIAVHVHPARVAFRRDRQKLRRAVADGNGTFESLFDEFPQGRRQILAAGPDLGRRDMQPSGAALLRQDDRCAGIRRNDAWLVCFKLGRQR